GSDCVTTSSTRSVSRAVTRGTCPTTVPFRASDRRSSLRLAFVSRGEPCGRLGAQTRGHFFEHLEHGGGRGRPIGARPEGDASAAGKDVALDFERSDEKVASCRGDGQLGNERDAKAGSDEPLHGHRVVASKDDDRLETGGPAGSREHLNGRAAMDALHPLLLGQLAQAEAAAEPMAGWERHVEAVVEQVHIIETVERCRLLGGELVDEGDVQLPRAELRERLLGIELNERSLDSWMALSERDDGAWDEQR